MDTNKLNELSTGQKVAGGSGAVAAIASFLPWYTSGDEFFSFSVKGTSFGFGWMGALLLIAAAALVVAPAFDKSVGNDDISGEQIAIAAGALGALMWAFRFISVPGGGFAGVNRGIGLFLAVAAAAGVIAGVVMTMKEKDIAMPNMENFKAIGGSSTTTSPAADVLPAPPQTDTVEF